MEDALGGILDGKDTICNYENDQQVGSDEDSFCDEKDDRPIESDEDNDDSAYEVFHEKAEMSLPASPRLPQANHTILNQKDIQKRQEEVISEMASMLLVPRSDGVILLEHFNWNISKVNEEWFADEERVRKSLGLVDSRPEEERSSLSKEMRCGICFEQHYVELVRSNPTCGHFFCDTCWTAYIHTAIKDGPDCLNLRCPDPSCRAAIRDDMVLSLASQEDGGKYQRYRLRGFVENSQTTKWCPSPGCEYAVECGPHAGSLDIVCKCSQKFCWDCLNEAHRPADCQTVAKWLLKHGSESENMNWILANSKACPKCQRPIEKNEGCMHVICNAPCGFQFCWDCLERWPDHKSPFHACTGNEKAMQEGLYDEEERKLEMAKYSLALYTHYHEGWAENELSRAKALTKLQQMEAVQTEKLRDKKHELIPLTEAWRQIVECRRVLKWTYAYGYYIPDHDRSKQELFERHLREAEARLERLQQCAEKELQKDFNKFRVKLIEMTIAARNYFTTLERDL